MSWRRCSSPTTWRRCCRWPRRRQVRKELGELGVRVIRLGTVPEQMLYDKERLVVEGRQAGRGVVREHRPDAAQFRRRRSPARSKRSACSPRRQATQPGAAARQYVPPSDKVLLASRLLQPREAQKLSFTAPTQPGVYPYVCTYPGHWRRMYGAHLRRRGPGRIPGRSGGLSGASTRCRSRTIC